MTTPPATRVRIPVPWSVERTCIDCDGTGLLASEPCPACWGTGRFTPVPDANEMAWSHARREAARMALRCGLLRQSVAARRWDSIRAGLADGAAGSVLDAALAAAVAEAHEARHWTVDHPLGPARHRTAASAITVLICAGGRSSVDPDDARRDCDLCPSPHRQESR